MPCIGRHHNYYADVTFASLSHVELCFSPKRSYFITCGIAFFSQKKFKCSFCNFFPRCGQICASCSCTRFRPPWRPTTSSPCGSSALQKGSKPTLAHRLLLIIDNQWNLVWPRQIKDSQSKATKCMFFLWTSPLNLISGGAARWKLSQISCMHLNDLWINNQNKTNFILKLFLIARTFGTKSLCFLFLNLYYKSIYWTLDYIWLFVFRVDMWPLKSENKPNKQFYAVILQLQYVQCRMNICVEANNSSHKS